MPMKSLILAVAAAMIFQFSSLGAQEQLRGREQLRGAVPAQKPIETGSSGLTPQQVYQQAGPAVVLLIWMYLVNLIVMVGCEFNAEYDRLESEAYKRRELSGM